MLLGTQGNYQKGILPEVLVVRGSEIDYHGGLIVLVFGCFFGGEGVHRDVGGFEGVRSPGGVDSCG